MTSVKAIWYEFFFFFFFVTFHIRGKMKFDTVGRTFKLREILNVHII